VTLTFLYLLSNWVKQVLQLFILLTLDRCPRLRLLLQFLEKRWVRAILLLVVLHGTLSDATLELETSPVHIWDFSWCLTSQLCSSALVRLELFILLPVLELIAVLQTFDCSLSVNTDTARSIAKWSVKLHSSLSLNNFTCFASWHEVDRIIFEFVFARHFWIFYLSFLRTWFSFFYFFLSCFGFDWWIIHLWLLFVCSVHTIEHLTHISLAAKVLVQVCIIDAWLFFFKPRLRILLGSCLLVPPLHI